MNTDDRFTKDGQAVFLAPAKSLWDLRQATKRAYLKEAEQEAYTVKKEELYYVDMPEQLLGNAQLLKEIIDEYKNDMSGTTDGKLNCVAILGDSREGILLHLEGDILKCAYYPTITKHQACGEHTLAVKLAMLADEADNISICINRPIFSGRLPAKELLHYLSKQMEL